MGNVWLTVQTISRQSVIFKTTGGQSVIFPYIDIYIYIYLVQ